MSKNSMIDRIIHGIFHHDFFDDEFSLALGGGAARGFAHIGIIRFLEENNYVPKEISGTSMGAIIGALYASGFNSAEIQKICLDINYLKLIDIDLTMGLLKGDKMLAKFTEMFGDKKIEDTKIRLKIIASNIETGEKVIFEKGKIVDALRSAVSIPSLVSPNKIDGKYLVDGGILNNLPIEVLSSKNILAVSVLRDLNRPIEFKDTILGFEFKKNLFGISYQIMQKTLDIMMKQNETKSLQTPDKNIILIEPSFPQIDYYEFHRYKEIMEVGYEEIKKRFEEKK